MRLGCIQLEGGGLKVKTSSTSSGSWVLDLGPGLEAYGCGSRG